MVNGRMATNAKRIFKYIRAEETYQEKEMNCHDI
jgi:hypothetical protein